jgi:hypothetical protein
MSLSINIQVLKSDTAIEAFSTQQICSIHTYMYNTHPRYKHPSITHTHLVYGIVGRFLALWNQEAKQSTRIALYRSQTAAVQGRRAQQLPSASLSHIYWFIYIHCILLAAV